MPFRNIVVENPARISVKNSQLIIHTDSDHSVAVEDISALLLESRQTTITAAALSTLGECGCCFTIPRNARELQQLTECRQDCHGFTIPRNARELQLTACSTANEKSFTIPRNARELQLFAIAIPRNLSFTIPRNAREYNGRK